MISLSRLKQSSETAETEEYIDCAADRRIFESTTEYQTSRTIEYHTTYRPPNRSPTSGLPIHCRFVRTAIYQPSDKRLPARLSTSIQQDLPAKTSASTCLPDQDLPARASTSTCLPDRDQRPDERLSPPDERLSPRPYTKTYSAVLLQQKRTASHTTTTWELYRPKAEQFQVGRRLARLVVDIRSARWGAALHTQHNITHTPTIVSVDTPPSAL